MKGHSKAKNNFSKQIVSHIHSSHLHSSSILLRKILLHIPLLFLPSALHLVSFQRQSSELNKPGFKVQLTHAHSKCLTYSIFGSENGQK